MDREANSGVKKRNIKISRVVTAAFVTLIAALMVDPHLLLVLGPVTTCILLIAIQREKRREKRGDVGVPPVSSSLDRGLDASQQPRRTNNRQSRNGINGEYRKK